MNIFRFGGQMMDIFIDKFAQRKNAQEMIKANYMAEAEENERLTSKLRKYDEVMQDMRRLGLQNIENAEKVKALLDEGMKKIQEIQSSSSVDDATLELLKNQQTMLEELTKTLPEAVTDPLQKQQSFVAEQLKEQQEKINEALKMQQDAAAELLKAQQDKVAELLKEQQDGAAELLKAQQTAMEEMMLAQKRTMEELEKASEDFMHKESVKVYRNVQAVLEEELPKQTATIEEKVREIVAGVKVGKGILPVCILTLLATLANIAVLVAHLWGLL